VALSANSEIEVNPMRHISWTGILLACSALAETGNVSGNWKIQSSASGNQSDTKCEFMQKGEELTGNCTTSRGKTVPVRGSVKGGKITWILHSEYDGGPLTITYTGKLVGAKKITGALRVDEVGVDGDFEATLGN
jgi:hypothetical protein